MRKISFIVTLLLFVTVLFALSACGTQEEQSTTEEPVTEEPVAEEPLKIGKRQIVST